MFHLCVCFTFHVYYVLRMGLLLPLPYEDLGHHPEAHGKLYDRAEACSNRHDNTKHINLCLIPKMLWLEVGSYRGASKMETSRKRSLVPVPLLVQVRRARLVGLHAKVFVCGTCVS